MSRVGGGHGGQPGAGQVGTPAAGHHGRDAGPGFGRGPQRGRGSRAGAEVTDSGPGGPRLGAQPAGDLRKAAGQQADVEQILARSSSSSGVSRSNNSVPRPAWSGRGRRTGCAGCAGCCRCRARRPRSRLRSPARSGSPASRTSPSPAPPPRRGPRAGRRRAQAGQQRRPGRPVAGKPLVLPSSGVPSVSSTAWRTRSVHVWRISHPFVYGQLTRWLAAGLQQPSTIGCGYHAPRCT